jgi:cyclohexanecarboxylate-CoA ligase
VRVSAADEKHAQNIRELRLGWGEEWLAQGLHSEVPLAGHIAQAVAVHADAVQVFVSEHGRERTTLGELYVSGLSVSRALTRLGLGPEDAIAVHMHHSADALVAYIATCLVGSTLVPIPGIYEERETAFILADSQARMLITEASWRGHDYVSAVSAYLDSGSLEYAVVVGECPASPSYLRFDDLKHDSGNLLLPVTSRSISHKAAIIYTSGSTAVPKGAIHTDQAVVYELAQSCPDSRMAGQKLLHAVAAGHMGGFLAVFKVLLRGASGVWLDKWDPGLALKLVQEYGLNAGTLVPFHLMTLLEAMEAADCANLGLNDVLCGSAAVPKELVEAADERGIAACRGYGSTEHPTISRSEPNATLAERSASDGTLLSGVTVRVVDDDGSDVPPGADGELVCKGPDQFLEYTRSDHNRGAFTDDGFFCTGDIARIDGDIVTVTGRKKEIIIRGGLNISIHEIEELLRSHPLVRDVAVIGVPDPRYGERVWAFLETRDRRAVSLAEMQEHFSRLGVARQKTPEALVALEALPRTLAGKVSKRTLKQMVQDGEIIDAGAPE